MTTLRKGRWFAVSVLFAAIAVAPVAAAADFPTKPIRVVIPFPPGGGLDTTVRTIEPEVSKRLGQQLIVDNRAGAGGAIGGQMVARSAPDGYTLLVYANTASIDPTYRPKLPYSFQRDFIPVTILVSSPYVLVANLDLPARNIAGLIAHAKANPGKVHFGSPGIGTIGHMIAEYFKFAAGIDIVHVPYKGSGPVMAGVMGGEIQLSFETAQIMELARSGKVRALAVTSKERWPNLTEVPPVSETLADFEMLSWIGLFAPARTPADVVERIYKAFSEAVRTGDSGAALVKRGMKGVGNTPADFAKQIETEIPMWAKVIRDAKLKPEE